MDRIVVDFELKPGKFEPGMTEISSEVQELMNNGLDVRHYLSRHLVGDCGYLAASEHDSEIAQSQKSLSPVWNPQSEYIIAPDKVLGILTYTMPPDGPSTTLGVYDIDPQNLKELRIEELYITAMTLLNQLPPDEKEKIIISGRQKIL